MEMNEQRPIWLAVLALVLAWMGREGAGIYFKWRERRMVEENAEGERYLSGYRELIGELKARVSTLEETLKSNELKYDIAMSTVRNEHSACLENQAAQAVKIATLEEQVKALWRHDEVNKKQAEIFKEALDSKTKDKSAEEDQA